MTTLEELLGLSTDAAVVISPDGTHENAACSLSEAGVVVLLEGPIAITIEGTDRVLETAYWVCTLLYVDHNIRHMDVVRTLHRVTQEGHTDEVKAIWCRHFAGSGGGYCFRGWHADRGRTTGPLLQEAAHDIDVMSWLPNSVSTHVIAMGDLVVYGALADRSGQNDGTAMEDWFFFGNWPSETQTRLNSVIDVENLSMLLARRENGTMIPYEQCHFTPDYWHNYTVIGTRGRTENSGGGEGGSVRVWAYRSGYGPIPDLEIPLRGDTGGHDDIDANTMDEFIRFVVNGDITDMTPLGACEAIAIEVATTTSLRNGNVPVDVPRVRPEVAKHFNRNQPR